MMKNNIKLIDLVSLIFVGVLFIAISIADVFGYFIYYDSFFVFILFAFLVVITFITIQIVRKQDKEKKVLRISMASMYFLSGACYFIVVLVDLTGYSLTPNGVFISILFWLAFLVCMLSVAFNVYRAIKLPKYISNKQLLKNRTRDSQQAIQKLRELKMLFDAGAIPQDVYEEKRKKYTDLI